MCAFNHIRHCTSVMSHGARKEGILKSGCVLSQAFAEEQSAMLADLPSVEDGNFTQTQAGQAPSAALEAMEMDEGEAPAPQSAASITLHEALQSPDADPRSTLFFNLCMSMACLSRQHHQIVHMSAWVPDSASEWLPSLRCDYPASLGTKLLRSQA